MAHAQLLRWFHAGVAAVDARERVRAALAPQPIPQRWHLLAVGKAATAMAEGALAAWPRGCAGGVVVAPVGASLLATETVTVCGPLCTPLDVLAQRIELPVAVEGDFVVIGMSGAYGATASPRGFLSHPGPVELLVAGPVPLEAPSNA